MYGTSNTVKRRAARYAAALLALSALAIALNGHWSVGARLANASGGETRQTTQATEPNAPLVTTCPGTPAQCFADVLSGSPFFDYANRLYEQEVISGYSCGGPGEPCDVNNRPYYRPGSNVNRGQMTKFVDNARHMPGIYINSSTDPSPLFVHLTTSIGAAVTGFSDDATGVFGRSYGGTGVMGLSSTGVAVWGSGSAGVGVQGISNSGRGVAGFSDSWQGVYGQSNTQAGVVGESRDFDGVYAITHNGNFAGVSGHNDAGGTGVWGSGTTGVYGINSAPNGGAGVGGESHNANGTAVYGAGYNGTGVYGEANGSGKGVFGANTDQGGYAGYFSGNVHVTGSCCSSANLTTQIDHPLDPANKYLNQSAVQSPDMKNIYDGNVTTDAKGDATVTLPDYFEALNSDYRYQLTVIGEFAQAIVSSKVKNDSFTIKTDKPNVEVSWQVTGIRHDPYAEAHPTQAEQAKPEKERGLYLHPELYGQPDSKRIGK